MGKKKRKSCFPTNLEFQRTVPGSEPMVTDTPPWCSLMMHLCRTSWLYWGYLKLLLWKTECGHFPDPDFDLKPHLCVPCCLHLRKLGNLWNSVVTPRNLCFFWGNGSHGAWACGCTASLISQLSSILGGIDVFVEGKASCQEEDSQTRKLALQQKPSSDPSHQSQEGVVNNNYPIPLQRLEIAIFHLPQQESVLNIPTFGQRSWERSLGWTASESVRRRDDNLGELNQWEKGGESERTAGGKFSWALPALHSLWGVMVNEPWVSTSFGYLLSVRSWAVYIMPLILIFPFMKWECKYFPQRVFGRIRWNKIDEEPGGVPIIMCTIT